MDDTDGLSFVICCHNGKQRIHRTLISIASQGDSDSTNWEVVLVDNASNDRTVEVAQRVWQELGTPAPLLITQAPRLGLAHARLSGAMAARLPYLSFLDDDNLVCPGWSSTVNRLMREHPEVGVIGGMGVPLFEDGSPPWWFERFQHGFAVGPQWRRDSGPVPSVVRFYGAGLTVRRDAFVNIILRGFTPTLIGRAGTGLECGEDAEICLVMACDGWTAWFEPSLRFQHIIPAERLLEPRLLKLFQGFGRSMAVQDVYVSILERQNGQRWRAMLRTPVPRFIQCVSRLVSVTACAIRDRRSAERLFIRRVRRQFILGHKQGIYELGSAAMQLKASILEWLRHSDRIVPPLNATSSGGPFQ